MGARPGTHGLPAPYALCEDMTPWNLGMTGGKRHRRFVSVAIPCFYRPYCRRGEPA
jgi:hypothetical protein